MTDPAGYRGVFGAVPFAFRASDSWLFRTYVLLGGGTAVLLAVVFTLGLVVTVANTLGTGGGTFTFARAFVVTVGLLVVLPLLAPVLLVARRHRRSAGDRRYDAALSATGYLFGAALYAGLLISTPDAQQETPPAVIAPIVTLLYDLPAPAGLLPPAVAVGLMVLAHRWLR